MLQNTLLSAVQLLKHTESARLDAEILLAHVLKKVRSYLLAWPEYVLTAEQNQQFQNLLARRLKGESIAHILGEKEFWSLTLEVTPDTLIPRPDTELLVELALQKLPENAVQMIADLGTGSGAIALAIASERPHWQIIATDKYPETLAVAKRNAAKLGLVNVYFYLGNWCEALLHIDNFQTEKTEIRTKFNAIISNPPYISASDPHLRSPNLLFEPQQALISDKDGYADLNQIINQAKAHLFEGGWLLLEHGFDQAVVVQQQMQAAGYKNISSHRDLSGHLRATAGQYVGDQPLDGNEHILQAKKKSMIE